MGKAKKQPSLELETHWDHFTPSSLGLTVTGDPTFQQWAKCGEFFQLAGRATSWWIGDWLNYGEGKYGEMYAQAVKETGLSKQTLMNLKWVAAKFEISRRRENLTFRHHSEVAALPAEEADAWLDQAEQKNLKAGELRSLIHPEGVKELPDPTPSAEKPDDSLADIDGNPKKCLEAVAAMVKALKKWRAFFSGLMATDYASHIENAAGGYRDCKPTKTGERVKAGELGPITFGPPEYTVGCLDELLGMCGGLRALFVRIGRDEIPGAGVGEWEA